MALRYFNITQQGRSHIEKNTHCQDASGMRLIRLESIQCDAIIGAVADGVGSCTFSEYGSQTAVKAVLDYLEEHLVTLSAISFEGVHDISSELRNAYQFALDKVEEKADEQYWSLPSLDTTLTTILYLEDGRLFFEHSGDGGIVALYTDGTYEMITSRQKGEEFNSVIPLRIKKWQYGKTRKPVASLAIMTDGVLDCWVRTELFRNRVYFPFFRPLLAKPRNTQAENQQCENELNAYLRSAAFREQVKDDITFATVQNSELVAQLPDIPFNEDDWEQETKELSGKIDKSLAEGAKEIQAKINDTPHKGSIFSPFGQGKSPSPGSGLFSGGLFRGSTATKPAATPPSKPAHVSPSPTTAKPAATPPPKAGYVPSSPTAAKPAATPPPKAGYVPSSPTAAKPAATPPPKTDYATSSQAATKSLPNATSPKWSFGKNSTSQFSRPVQTSNTGSVIKRDSIQDSAKRDNVVEDDSKSPT